MNIVFYTKNLLRAAYYVGFVLICLSCNPTPTPANGEPSDVFATTPSTYKIQPDYELGEASGLVDSKKQTGMLWSHEDAGQAAQLILLTHQGQVKGRLNVPTTNLDWEDLAIGPGPVENETYLYLAEIGDNESNREAKAIRRFIEPKSLTDPIAKVDNILFKLPDGTFDCEAILFDPLTKDIFVVTKWLTKARVYRLAYPQTLDKMYAAEKVADMTVGSDITGGAVSVDGREVIVRGYSNIYYWKRKNAEPIGDVLKRNYDKILPYIFEPQGEAVCFKQDGSGYFTLSEKRTAPFTSLYFYKRE